MILGVVSVSFLACACVLLAIERKRERRNADFKKHQQKLMSEIQERFEKDFSRFYR